MNGFCVYLFEGVDSEICSGHGLNAVAGHPQTVSPSIVYAKLGRLGSDNVNCGDGHSLRGKDFNLDLRLNAALVVGANAHR